MIVKTLLAMVVGASVSEFALFSGTATANDTAYPLGSAQPIRSIQLDPRPFYLVEDMAEGPLKAALRACAADTTSYRPSRFVIGHRGGADLQFPEHSLQSNLAGARMGAGILECDVTFTADRELVCRHSHCDLHTTTNIVAVPELNAKCTRPFSPASADGRRPASARCCTSDITLAEFKSLCAKMDGFDPRASTPEEFAAHGTPAWRTDLYSTCGTVMSLREHIAAVDALGLDFTPELKQPEVPMPFRGNYTQEMYAQQMIDAFREAGIAPERVWPQSFFWSDLLYWLDREPAFARRAMLLDVSADVVGGGGMPGAVANLTEYAAAGLRVVAPPMQYLVASADGRMVPSAYAERAGELGLEVVAWTLERSGRIPGDGQEYYYSSVKDLMKTDGDVYVMLDVLARQVGIAKIFTDWASSATFYANCFGIFP